jgi:hypothetical protein
MELTIVPSDLAFDVVSNNRRADLELSTAIPAGDREAPAALLSGAPTLRETDSRLPRFAQ